VAESEILVLVLTAALAVVGVSANHTGSLHALYFRGNPGPGIVRLGVVLAMAWIGYVLWRHADPSVTGVYIFFYLVMGYAAVKVFGQWALFPLGIRTRIDVGERRNVAAALVIGGFALATGLIFGGSLWGEADPVGGDEGGWWIPVTFFLLGWTVLIACFWLFMRREPTSFARRIRRERSVVDGRAAAVFLVSCAVPLTDAVAGDFWGWRHGLLTFAFLAGLVLAHEGFASLARPTGPVDRPEKDVSDARRVVESLAYLAIASLAWGANRLLDVGLRPG
jgi:hypothetical protein